MTSAIALFLLSTVNVSSRLVRSVEYHQALKIEDIPTNEKTVIVVAGASHYTHSDEYGTSSPTPDGLVRLNYAANLHNRTGLPVSLTGGPISGTVEPHAEVMARTLDREYGIKATHLERESRTTLQNALFSADILRADGVSTIILVTHSYHMVRSVMLFEHAGFQVIPAPTQLSHHYALTDWWYWMPNAEALSLSARVIYEIIATAWYQTTLDLTPSFTPVTS